MTILNPDPRLLQFDENTSETSTATTTERGSRGKTLGTIGGRRVHILADHLIIPNTPQGRALATVLTGETIRPGRVKRFALSLARCKNAEGILPLFMAIVAAIDENADGGPVRAYLESIEILAAERLSRDPWITLERAQAWYEWCSDPGNVRESVNWRAIMVIKLRDHIEPPMTKLETKLQFLYGKNWRNHPDAPKAEDDFVRFDHQGKYWKFVEM